MALGPMKCASVAGAWVSLGDLSADAARAQHLFGDGARRV